MKISPKILKINRQGFQSIRLSIVRYFRDHGGRPTYETLCSFPTVRSTLVTDRNVQENFWMRVNTELDRLINQNYMRNDIDVIRQRFAKVVPEPILRPATATKGAPVLKALA